MPPALADDHVSKVPWAEHSAEEGESEGWRGQEVRRDGQQHETSSPAGGRVKVGPPREPPVQFVPAGAVMCELENVDLEEAMRFLSPKQGPQGELLEGETDSMSSVGAGEVGGAGDDEDNDLPIKQRVSRAVRYLRELESSLPGREVEQRGDRAGAGLKCVNTTAGLKTVNTTQDAAATERRLPQEAIEIPNTSMHNE